MRLWGCLLVLAALTAGGTLLSPAKSRPAGAPVLRSPEGGCKPTAPIDLTARLVGDPATGFTVEASATARTGAEVELEVLLPDGVAHVAGPRKLKARKAETRVDARAKHGGRQEILVRATFTDNGATMTKVLPIVLNDAPAAKPGTPARSGRGERILEFSP